MESQPQNYEFRIILKTFTHGPLGVALHFGNKILVKNVIICRTFYPIVHHKACDFTIK